MNKFDIHETLRLYLPGLFSVIMINYFLDLHLNDARIALAGIFLGLIIDSFDLSGKAFFFHVYHAYKYKKFFVIRRYYMDLFLERRNIFLYRFEKYKLSQEVIDYLRISDRDSRNPHNPLSRALVAFDSTRYNNIELQQMRLLNSYGRVNFTLAVLFFSSSIITIITGKSKIILHNHLLLKQINLDSVIYLLCGIALLNGAVKMWNKSLKFEIQHYKSYSKDALQRLESLLLLEIRDSKKVEVS